MFPSHQVLYSILTCFGENDQRLQRHLEFGAILFVCEAVDDVGGDGAEDALLAKDQRGHVVPGKSLHNLQLRVEKIVFVLCTWLQLLSKRQASVVDQTVYL